MNEWICRVYGLGIGIDESEKAERVLMKWSDTSEFSLPSHATPPQCFYSDLGVLYGTKSVGEKNPICDVSLKIMPKLVLWDQVAKAGVVNAGY